MCQTGELVLQEDFAGPLGKPWRIAKGKWEHTDGSVQGSELKSDNHGAVIRTNLKIHDLIASYEFRLEGARVTTFSINDAKGHNSRLIIRPTGLMARKDDHDHKGPDKAVLLETVKADLDDGKWHEVVIEINGPEFLASVDGKQIAYGSHEAIDVDKTNIGLTVSGQSVSFRNLKIWKATEKPEWKKTRGSLRKKKVPSR